MPYFVSITVKLLLQRQKVYLVSVQFLVVARIQGGSSSNGRRYFCANSKSMHTAEGRQKYLSTSYLGPVSIFQVFLQGGMCVETILQLT